MAQTPEGYKFPINLSFVDTYVVSVQINFRQGQRQSSLCRAQERKEKMIMEKMMNTKTEGNTFTKKIGQTVYVVRYHFNEFVWKSADCLGSNGADWKQRWSEVLIV